MYKYDIIDGELYCNVYLDTQGGEELEPIKVKFNSFLPEIKPVRIGHTFKGWYKDPEYEKVWDPDTDRVIEQLTLYAQWDINTYKVNFDTKGGNEIPEMTIEYGSTISDPPVAERDGYTFAGWYKDADCTEKWDFSTDKVSEDIILYAGWNHTISFDSQGGSFVDNIIVEPGSLIKEPPIPERDGYTFEGWYKESDCVTPWDFDNDTVNINATLYAKWKINSYMITFNSMGGSTVESIKADYNTLINAPQNPVRDGYVFAGWFTDTDYQNEWNFESDTVTGDMTLYARWIKDIPEYITSGVYYINSGIGIISKIKWDTTVGAFINNINEKDYINVFKGNEQVSVNSLLGTGMSVKISDGSTVKRSYTVVVTGDINGDGKITLTDYVKLKSYILNKESFDNSQFKAADVDGNGTVNLTDYVKFRSHLLNKELIVPQKF